MRMSIVLKILRGLKERFLQRKYPNVNDVCGKDIRKTNVMLSQISMAMKYLTYGFALIVEKSLIQKEVVDIMKTFIARGKRVLNVIDVEGKGMLKMDALSENMSKDIGWGRFRSSFKNKSWFMSALPSFFGIDLSIM